MESESKNNLETENKGDKDPVNQTIPDKEVKVNLDLESDEKKSCCTIKMRVITANIIWSFTTAIVRSVIFSTLWSYLLDINFWNHLLPNQNSTMPHRQIAEQYYGIIVSAFSIGSLISMPFYGIIVSKSILSSKSAIIIGIVLEICGALLYVLAYHPWMLLVGRLLSGFGSGVQVNIMSDTILVTHIDERTQWVSLVIAVGQMGIVAGPGINMAVNKVSDNYGKLQINQYNMSMVIIGIAWILILIYLIILYPSKREFDEFAQSDPEKRKLIEEDSPRHENCNCFSLYCKCLKDNCNKQVVSVFLVNLLNLVFVFMYDAIVSPFTSKMLRWTTFQVSLIFLIGGVVVIVGFFVLQILLKWLDDKGVIILGMVLQIIGYGTGVVHSIAFYIFGYDHYVINVIIFGFELCFYSFGVLFGVMCTDALFSKFINNPRDTELSQTIFRMSEAFSFIVGPIIAGALVNYVYGVFSIQLILAILGLILIICFV